MAGWLVGWLAVIPAIKLYGIGQPNKVFDAIKTTLIFPPLLLALVSLLFHFVSRVFATRIGETIYLGAKVLFGSSTHTQVACLSFRSLHVVHSTYAVASVPQDGQFLPNAFFSFD